MKRFFSICLMFLVIVSFSFNVFAGVNLQIPRHINMTINNVPDGVVKIELIDSERMEKDEINNVLKYQVVKQYGFSFVYSNVDSGGNKLRRDLQREYYLWDKVDESVKKIKIGDIEFDLVNTNSDYYMAKYIKPEDVEVYYLDDVDLTKYLVIKTNNVYLDDVYKYFDNNKKAFIIEQLVEEKPIGYINSIGYTNNLNALKISFDNQNVYHFMKFTFKDGSIEYKYIWDISSIVDWGKIIKSADIEYDYNTENYSFIDKEVIESESIETSVVDISKLNSDINKLLVYAMIITIVSLFIGYKVDLKKYKLQENIINKIIKKSVIVEIIFNLIYILYFYSVNEIFDLSINPMVNFLIWILIEIIIIMFNLVVLQKTIENNTIKKGDLVKSVIIVRFFSKLIIAGAIIARIALYV